ncbi:MAG: DUF2075 domain-containing protein [Erysipelotrichaceae bacterium]|nr:DUF2075 domain-containing protein [Erysipelotrichaceae bacterium]
MIVYEALKHEFVQDVYHQRIDDKIRSLVLEKAGIHVSIQEIHSWANSLTFVNNVINTPEIPDDSGIAIEYKIPNTSKRVDLILSGYDESDKPRAVIIELKQWSEVEKVNGQDAIVRTVLGGSKVNTTHPSYQAWSYASLIHDYNEDVRKKNIELFPCAFLHNYSRKVDDPLLDDDYSYYMEQAPVFIKGDNDKLRDFIKKYLKKGDQKQVIYDIERGRIVPSKMLQESVLAMVKGNPEFIMIDEQKVIYERAKELAHLSFKDGQKRIFVVKGGPGTGKSVLAIHLLAELMSAQSGKVCRYVTKNAAPRNIFKRKLQEGGYKKPFINALFSGSGEYTQTSKNQFDVLVIDEAHRLNEKSGLMGNLGENQIKEIIHAVLFSIFFIDERQKITVKDIGSIKEIKKWAQFHKAEIYGGELQSQFRCNGSDGYLAWIDHILQIRETANTTFDKDFDYDFRIVDSPNELRDLIIEKNKINNRARLLAGYCWDWDSQNKNNPSHFDIKIPEHDFAMAWNLGNTETWAIDPESVNQVGCIHTSQGLEFDYVGVIIGDDIRYEDGKIITDFTKRANTDATLKGLKTIVKTDPEKARGVADEIIKNTYRTLLTRGQKGCYVYISDFNLMKLIKSVDMFQMIS